MDKVAIVAGSTGLVGSKLLLQLLENEKYSKVITVVRKPTGLSHPKLREHIVDFNKIEDYAHLFKADIFFSCLGSTKAKTPDKKLYYRIDHDYPLTMAKLCSANGASECHLISAIAANAASSNFYIRMKGEVERDVAALPYKAVHIYRPSMLTGIRNEKRTVEQMAMGLFRIINPLLIGGLRKYRSIDVNDVAQAMLCQSVKNLNGVHYYESDDIQRLANVL